MRSCVESNIAHVFVNGSPTLEFKPQRGLRQGDLLAPFLLLVVAKGLSGLMRIAIEKNMFKSYMVGIFKVEINLL